METKWIQKVDGEREFWECGNCKVPWVFTDGTPKDNDLRYCPKCGFKVTQIVCGGLVYEGEG